MCTLYKQRVFSLQTQDNECGILGKSKWRSEPIMIRVLSDGKRCGGTGRYGVADWELKCGGFGT